MKKLKLLNLALAGTIALSSLWSFHDFASAASIGEEISNEARKYIGTKITSFDSGDFVSYIFKKEGISTPSDLNDLSRVGTLILDKSKLDKGDVVFFGTSRSDLIAAGIYVGQGDFIIAYKPYNQIKRIDLNDEVAKKYFLGAKRIRSASAPTPSKPSQPINNKKPAWEVTADRVIAHGMHHLGTEYKLGATYEEDRLFDCSSFTQHMFDKGAGFNLKRASRPQFLYDGNKQLTRDQLRKGDLIFFTTIGNYKKYDEGDYRRNGHVGIVKEVRADGSIDILHTFKPGVGVVVETMRADKKDSWSKAFLYGKRVIADDGTEAPDVTMKKDGLVEGK